MVSQGVALRGARRRVHRRAADYGCLLLYFVRDFDFVSSAFSSEAEAASVPAT